MKILKQIFGIKLKKINFDLPSQIQSDCYILNSLRFIGCDFVKHPAEFFKNIPKILLNNNKFSHGVHTVTHGPYTVYYRPIFSIYTLQKSLIYNQKSVINFGAEDFSGNGRPVSFHQKFQNPGFNFPGKLKNLQRFGILFFKFSKPRFSGRRRRSLTGGGGFSVNSLVYGFVRWREQEKNTDFEF